MRYAIWHTPRTGSNYLCNVLHKTGKAGIADYLNCGFFVGWHVDSLDHFRALRDEYFAKQRTANGVEGCKIGIQYFEHLAQRSQTVTEYELYCAFKGTLNAEILLTRKDKVSQAVSLYIAAQMNNFSSLAKQPKQGGLEYNRPRIRYHYANIISQESKHTALAHGYQLNYEDFAADPQKCLDTIAQLLNIDSLTYAGTDLKKQFTELNQRFADQFRKDLGLYE